MTIHAIIRTIIRMIGWKQLVIAFSPPAKKDLFQETDETQMSKKITSTIFLFAVFIGFLWWGLTMLTTTLSTPNKDGETIIYAILLLCCAGYALYSLLLLPRRREP
jgi:hypothetical protein